MQLGVLHSGAVTMSSFVMVGSGVGSSVGNAVGAKLGEVGTGDGARDG